MIKPIKKIEEENMRLYRGWLASGKKLTKAEYVDRHASEEFKEYQRILGEELEKAHSEGLLV